MTVSGFEFARCLRVAGFVMAVFRSSRGCAIRRSRYNATIAKAMPILELMAISSVWGFLSPGLSGWRNPKKTLDNDRINYPAKNHQRRIARWVREVRQTYRTSSILGFQFRTSTLRSSWRHSDRSLSWIGLLHFGRRMHPPAAIRG